MNDKKIQEAIEREAERQLYNIELIASENYVSRDVLEAAGSILTNKYAEGYPSKRYYGGCVHVDEIEEIARERAKQLFTLSMPMCSRTVVLRQIWAYIYLFYSQAILYWG